MKPLVIVLCEFSGIVSAAFRDAGCEAYSCDILPTEGDPCWHIQGDALEVLRSREWALVIAHPPCTYLCNSGVRWLAPGGVVDSARHLEMQRACDFFAAFYNANCPRVCVENPMMHKYARDYLQSVWRVPARSMSLQPYEHGHGETKRTCLWTRGLPDLQPSHVVPGRTPRVHHASPGPDRWKERSRTLPGIAKAMASQWSPLLFA